jgi:hypothetical protein
VPVYGNIQAAHQIGVQWTPIGTPRHTSTPNSNGFEQAREKITQASETLEVLAVVGRWTVSDHLEIECGAHSLGVKG